LGFEFYVSPEDYQTALSNGICADTLENRIRRHGWHKERAITEPPQKRTNLKELVKIAEQNGIPYHVIQKRMYDGWDAERATTQPLTNKADLVRKQHEKNRKYPKQYVDRAKENGIPYKTFTWRMRQGWSLERASETKVMTPQEVGAAGYSKSWWSKGPNLFKGKERAGIV